jgi:hypothetical protein
VKYFLNARASATGSGVSVATAAGIALNASAASARTAEANWMVDRTFNLQGVSGEATKIRVKTR